MRHSSSDVIPHLILPESLASVASLPKGLPKLLLSSLEPVLGVPYHWRIMLTILE